MITKTQRPPFSRRGEQAIQAAQEAALFDTMPRREVGDDIAYATQARHAHGRAELYLKPVDSVAVSAGEAVTWQNKADEIFPGAHARIVDTLEHPDTISVGASIDRTSAAQSAGVLEPAIDAAASAEAANSIEKMLCHQMAGAHFSAMRLLERSAESTLQPGDVARFTNAAARMMDVYQAGCQTLLKLKTRGEQRVTVSYQQVNVGPGGQAVIAGRVGGGSRNRGRGNQNGQ
jgi:plastocyanin